MIRTIADLLRPKLEQDTILVHWTDPIIEVAQTMKRHNVKLVIVIRNNKPVGVISTSDTSGELSELAEATRPSEKDAYHIMTRGVIKVRPEEKIEDVAKIMVHEDIRHIIVDNNGRWVVVPMKEVLDATTQNNIELEEAMERYRKGELFRD